MAQGKNQNSEQRMFVIAARVAAHLHFATLIAKQLSLTAKNARAITARAGQQAAGFTAITGFIQELATKTIQLSQDINQIAVKIAMQATQLERIEQAQYCIDIVYKNASDAAHIDSITRFTETTSMTQSTLNSDFSVMLFQLIDLVEQIRLQIRSAEVISTMSKVEASKSGSFEEQLKVIADNIFDAAADINKELTSAEKLLASKKR
jgi:hypothetical protein